jgi:hypothetical protein
MKRTLCAFTLTFVIPVLFAQKADLFLQPHYLLLNLAVGGDGGDPSYTRFPIDMRLTM